MFFLTTKNLGRNPLVIPQKCLEAHNGDLSLKPCICVAPSVWQCLLGICELDSIRVFDKNGRFSWRKRKRPFRIYKTHKRGYSTRIFDKSITGERRIYKPTEFVFVGFVPEYLVREAKPVIRQMLKHYDILWNSKYGERT